MLKVTGFRRRSGERVVDTFRTNDEADARQRFLAVYGPMPEPYTGLSEDYVDEIAWIDEVEDDQRVELTQVYMSETDVDGLYAVMGTDELGREYTLADRGGPRYLPPATASVVVARVSGNRMTINLEHWLCRAPYGTEAWLVDGEEERAIEDERAGFY